jgi:hypothetical protein
MITDEILNHLTREQTLTMWRETETSRDYLVEEKHGNGEQLVWFQTMDCRPFKYLIRVDSSLDISKSDDEILSEKELEELDINNFSDLLVNMIEEEYGNYIDSDGEEVEYKMPILSIGAGFDYGVYSNERLKEIFAEEIKGFINRKYNSLPNEACIIQILQNETIFLCSYLPHLYNTPPTLIGQATVVEGKHKGIGFNVWNNNDSEFIYYKIIQ